MEADLAEGGEASHWFRELGIGFHPGLAGQPGNDIVPYFGYGEGVIRMSLGDNEELGETGDWSISRGSLGCHGHAGVPRAACVSGRSFRNTPLTQGAPNAL